ncbi:(Fe-S)-binding protein [Desulfomonile tiedjei]|uniref:Fe-S oxidoreductase n=1 Tax=Desulfomonile tiedjei (strain ATCC 49306 / DSM 6799 / DCB-1) TaxID=706587 RepID=I4CBA3_DESTA|nr:(Fe-S)-binding protein [Desulfomonile tiedjei]AFM26844.1 Fe-S oxidoreductase [Desulfomonile tiedjei DSM 6799]
MSKTQEIGVPAESDNQKPEKLGAPEERAWPTKPSFTPDMLAEMERQLPSKLNRVVAASLAGCIHCGMCSDACHYSVSIPEDKTLVPAYKADRFRKWYKSRYDWMAKVFPKFVGAEPLTEKLAEEMYDKLYGGCTMCRRCTYNCPMGVDYGMMVRAARSLMQSVGRVPQHLQDTVDTHYNAGNNMAVPQDEFIETIEWIEEELQDEDGCADFKIPVDKKGAQYFLTLNPREPKYYPLTIQASAKVLNAAGVDFTISSRYWDLTNYALFNGNDPDAKLFAMWQAEDVKRLGCEYLLAGECGHGYRALRWELPNWVGGVPFKITSMMELMAKLILEKRIKLDKSVWAGTRFTYHDSCNIARSGGVLEEPRIVIRAAADDFVEMEHNRDKSFCCGGGGGALAMPEFTKRRIAAGKIKADEIRATGANVVLQSCHNCTDQLKEIIEHYGIEAKVMNLAELLSPALVLD